VAVTASIFISLSALFERSSITSATWLHWLSNRHFRVSIGVENTTLCDVVFVEEGFV
jgi:hypothetical protein